MGRKATVSRFIAIGTLAGTVGCINALHPYIGPMSAKLRLKASDPRNYAVRVDLEGGGVFKPDVDGRVVAEIPRFGRTCSLYFLFIPIRDERPDRLPVVKIVAGETVVRHFSVRDLSRLKQDADGYGIVRLR